MRHSQRSENILRAIGVKRHARNSLDQAQPHDEFAVAVSMYWVSGEDATGVAANARL